MIKNYMSIIYLGEDKKNIASLTKSRPLSSILIAGSYRIIDFALSNSVNAGIKNVGLFSGEDDISSLTDHIGIGSEWDLARKKDGIFVFRQMSDKNLSMNRDRIEKNMEYFIRSSQEYVVILSAHVLCNLDLNDIIKKHEESGKEITMVYKKINKSSDYPEHCNAIKLDKNKRVISIGQNIISQARGNISLETFVMSKKLAMKLLIDSIKNNKYATLPELIARDLDNLEVNSYEFKGYSKHISSTKEYFEFNMDILNKEIREDLFGENNDRKIFTRMKDTPPALFKKTAEVENSLVSNGCIIEGTLKNSVLSRGTIVEKGAVLENCIVLQDCTIKSNAILKNIIIDKNNIIASEEKLNASPEHPLVIEKQIRWDINKYKDLIDYINND